MIDIIIPAYNCSKTLGRTLSSLVAQTDTSFNVIIVDDCSNENLELVIDNFRNQLNIKYIRNDVNVGPGYSRQIGMDNSSSKFVAFLDADDMFMPYTVETFNTAIKANPDIEFLQTYFYEQLYLDGIASLALHKDNFTACHGKLYNMEVIRKFGIAFVPEVRWSEDAFFNSMCTELMKVSLLKVPTVIWTYTQGSLLRSTNEDRDKNRVKYFVQAMKLSAAFVKKFKSDISHLETSIQNVFKCYNLSEDEKNELTELLKGEM